MTQESEKEDAEDTWEASVIFQGGPQTHRDQDRPGPHPETLAAGDNEVRSAECDQNVWNNNTRAVYSGPHTPGPGHTLHLPGGARAVFSQQDISSFATRSLHYRIISFLLFSHRRKYYLVINNSKEKAFYINNMIKQLLFIAWTGLGCLRIKCSWNARCFSSHLCM